MYSKQVKSNEGIAKAKDLPFLACLIISTFVTNDHIFEGYPSNYQL